MNLPDNPTKSFKVKNPHLNPPWMREQVKPDAVAFDTHTANAAPGFISIRKSVPGGTGIVASPGKTKHKSKSYNEDEAVPPK